MRPSGGAWLAILGGLTLGLFVAGLAVSSGAWSWQEGIWRRIATDPELAWLILGEVRLPRTLIVAFAGASLGLCGAAMQGLLRNPLASPELVGSANGAALGAVTALYFGFAAAWPPALPAGGFLGALAATAAVYLLAGRAAGVATVILAGVAINSFAAALIALLLNLAPSPYAVQEILLWLLGSAANRSFQDLWFLLPGTLLGWLLLVGCGRRLDALTLGEETAQTLGMDPHGLRLRLFVAIALAVGSAVAVIGAVGFVGLVAPHLMRPLVAYRPGALLWPSALAGAALLLAADLTVRLMPAGTDLKLGVVTALVGGPFFLYLILRTRERAL